MGNDDYFEFLTRGNEVVNSLGEIIYPSFGMIIQVNFPDHLTKLIDDDGGAGFGSRVNKISGTGVGIDNSRGIVLCRQLIYSHAVGNGELDLSRVGASAKGE